MMMFMLKLAVFEEDGELKNNIDNIGLYFFVIFLTLENKEGGGECAVVWEDKKYARTKQLELKFQTRLDYIGRLDWFAKKKCR